MVYINETFALNRVSLEIADEEMVAITALDNVMLPLDFSSRKKKYGLKIALQALKDVGMEKLAYRQIHQMSGGEKQRVAIARAIANNPRFILPPSIIPLESLWQHFPEEKGWTTSLSVS